MLSTYIVCKVGQKEAGQNHVRQSANYMSGCYIW